MKALVLDFDGVISDSAPESFLVALRTFAELKPDSPFAGGWARQRRGPGPTRAEVRGDPLYARFLELMPLGNRAEDYAVMLSILEHGLEVRDQISYDRERRRQDSAFLEDFHHRFYETRQSFAMTHPGVQQRLIGSYPSFLDVLRRRASETVLAIATAKDRESVDVLLKHHGVADLFPAERILDKDTGVSKASHLETLHRRLGAAYSDMSFLDDKVNHLDTVSPLGVRCGLAAWGYNGPREHLLALERGYLVCRLDDVEDQLFG